MKQISINNGATYTTPAEALEEISLDTMAEYMDNDTREAVHNRCPPRGFLGRVFMPFKQRKAGAFLPWPL